MAYMRNRQLNGLGTFDPSALIPLAAKLIPGASGGGGGGAGSGVTVSPVISAQVSPQISPIFQQQFQPSNSPISAGASQFMPTTQGAAVPGYSGASPFPEAPSAGGLPLAPSGLTSTGPLPGTIFGMRTGYVIVGAAVIAAVILIARSKRKNRYSSRRVDLEV